MTRRFICAIEFDGIATWSEIESIRDAVEAEGFDTEFVNGYLKLTHTEGDEQ